MSAFVVNDPGLTFDPELHLYTLGDRDLPSVTQVLASAGVSDFNGPWFDDDAKVRGQMVHLAIALDNEGDLDDDTLDPVLEPFLAGWRRFVAESGAVIEHWERAVCDPELGFAGTLDGVIVLPNQKGVTRRTVVDVKRALYPSAGPQVAAYTRCARALYATPTVFNRAALVLPGDGSYQFQPLTDPSDEQVFLAALRVYHFRRAHGLIAA